MSAWSLTSESCIGGRNIEVWFGIIQKNLITAATIPLNGPRGTIADQHKFRGVGPTIGVLVNKKTFIEC